MTENHLRLLLKVVRAVGEDEFIRLLESDSLPKVKLSAAEIGIKEGFWGASLEACAKVGLVSSLSQKAA
jgi:hypothetical protein